MTIYVGTFSLEAGESVDNSEDIPNPFDLPVFLTLIHSSFLAKMLAHKAG
jgi:hypothetical protein